jgi:hypothetical protein
MSRFLQQDMFQAAPMDGLLDLMRMATEVNYV